MFQFTFPDKIIFLISLFVFKIISPVETKKGRFPIIVAELMWTLRPITKVSPNKVLKWAGSYYETKFGKFYTNPDLQSLITVSPAFERLDMEFLIDKLKKFMKAKKKILFIDVGAHIGLYTVAIGREFRKNRNLSIIAFEPNASNFFKDNFNILKNNVEINELKNVKLHKIGLGSKKSNSVNKFGIMTERLDTILSKSFIGKFDIVVMKIDIEGYETDALKGATDVIDSSRYFFLMVEDVVNSKVIDYLVKNKFSFVKKITPYNSFWEKPGR